MKPFLLDVLRTGFDVVRLVTATERVLETFKIGYSSRANGSPNESISLTSRRGAKEPLYDGSESQFDPVTNRKLYEEREFSEFNKEFLGTIFHDIYLAMPFQIGRMRINLLPPRTSLCAHKDSAPRAHVALITNPYCFISDGNGITTYVPADGNTYLFDTTKTHFAVNASGKKRYHLTISVADAAWTCDGP